MLREFGVGDASHLWVVGQSPSARRLRRMPTPDAKVFISDAQRLAEALRDLSDRQSVLVEKLRNAATAGALQLLHEQISSMRAVSLELSRQYAEAVDRYVSCVKPSLGDGAPPVFA
jgi:hypothetical protein